LNNMCFSYWQLDLLNRFNFTKQNVEQLLSTISASASNLNNSTPTLGTVSDCCLTISEHFSNYMYIMARASYTVMFALSRSDGY